MSGGRQLWLLEPPRPLVERLGESLFRSIPTGPGVYVMTGDVGRGMGEEVLYVGKAKNLRRRVRSYNGVRPGCSSRKTVRLVHSVRELRWETCRDEQEALLRENQLIRVLRPKFNRVNTWPRGYWFLGLKPGLRGHVVLCLQHERVPDWEWYGAFRGSRGYAACLRWLWRLQSAEPGLIPSALLRPRPLRCRELVLPESAAWFGGAQPVELIQRFVAGESRELFQAIECWKDAASPRGGFESSLEVQDLEALELFWRNGVHRNARLRCRFGLATTWIESEDLDDLLVMAGAGLAGETRTS